jgi:putative ATP-dependent endonuclease of OLD family
MRIKKIHIQNYRSIKNLDIYPSSICALVGENGAGKSNILAALDFLLGDRYPQSRSLEPSDYFNHDEKRKIIIGVEYEKNDEGIEKLWCNFEYGRKDEIKILLNGVQRYPTTEQREQCALVYVDAHRDIEKHMGQSRWTLLGKLLRRFNASFPEERQNSLKQNFDAALDLLRTEAFIQFEQELISTFGDQVKHLDKQLRMEFTSFDPLSYYKNIQLLLRREHEVVSLAEAGQGMRNLALLALFRAYAKVFRSDGIIAVEEPELYLHPHAERTLSALFRNLAQQGGQVFYTTHSSYFVETEFFDEICLVERKKDDEGDLCTQITQLSADKLVGLRKTLHPTKPITLQSLRERYHNICNLEHAEAFFARKIVLVEGEAEEFSLPIYANALGYNLDTHGVSVVNTRGKTNIDHFYHLYAAFGIPVFVVFDSDRGGKDNDLNYNLTLLQMLNAAQEREPHGVVSNTYAISDPDFEAEIRNAIGEEVYKALHEQISESVGKAGKGIVARILAQRLVNEGQIPIYIEKIVEKVKSLDDQEAYAKANDMIDIPF